MQANKLAKDMHINSKPNPSHCGSRHFAEIRLFHAQHTHVNLGQFLSTYTYSLCSAQGIVVLQRKRQQRQYQLVQANITDVRICIADRSFCWTSSEDDKPSAAPAPSHDQ